jgi:hypothetical protein
MLFSLRWVVVTAVAPEAAQIFPELVNLRITSNFRLDLFCK